MLLNNYSGEELKIISKELEGRKFLADKIICYETQPYWLQ